MESRGSDPRRGKDGGAAARYAAAERSPLEIMRSIGTTLGAPVMRQALQEQARTRIGDTGLRGPATTTAWPLPRPRPGAGHRHNQDWIALLKKF